MKQKKLCIVLLACLLAFSLSVPVFAQNEVDISAYARTTSEEPSNTVMAINEEGEQSAVSENTYFVNSDMYFFNEEVVVDMPVNGNVFIFGSNVTVSNTISGNVFVFGDNVTFDSNATIYGSVFAFGTSFTFNGHAYDIYAAGSTITFGPDTSLYRDIKTFSSNLTIDGQISRSVYSRADSIQIADTASIGKDFTYVSKNEVTVPEGLVTGEVTYTELQEQEDTKTVGDYVYSIVSQAIFVFVIFLACLGIAPKFSHKAATVLTKKWGASIGLGLAGIVLIPVFGIFLLTTGFATSLSIYVFTLYGLLLATSFSVVCIAVNQLLTNKFHITKTFVSILTLLLVAVVLGIVKLLPFMAFALTTFGLGIFIVSLFYQEEKKQA